MASSNTYSRRPKPANEREGGRGTGRRDKQQSMGMRRFGSNYVHFYTCQGFKREAVASGLTGGVSLENIRQVTSSTQIMHRKSAEGTVTQKKHRFATTAVPANGRLDVHTEKHRKVKKHEKKSRLNPRDARAKRGPVLLKNFAAAHTE